MKTSLSLAAVALALAACNPPADKPAPAAEATAAAVTASDAWCRPSPNGAKAGGCYVTLTAATDDRLTGGSTPRATELQVHEMKTENGMMKMAQLTEGLPLPAGQAVELKPGGNHLMLIGLTAPLVAGETVPITLKFASAPEVTVQAAVRQPAMPAMAGMDHAAH
ncbi:copper chaperone PCu(A)C [Brevundimonas aurantiaca]|jgi:copper(I)-binding protein|uniref:copper chaperone PCu(A)C n=1 Tax=Brevundimonas aurantiaca TaxID=74316 RepID=UPI001D1818C0|nr:copper chaperone PCu(A)C [Brevundimonas aurantiaca]MCC4293674.1 copper chaperone PCu(A)C [Brevundimonas aurantiaca]